MRLSYCSLQLLRRVVYNARTSIHKNQKCIHVIGHVTYSSMSKRSSSRVASSAAKKAKNEEERRLKFDLSWKFVGEEGLAAMILLDGPAAATSTGQVAAFDLDSTLIKPASGKKFPINTSDWQFFDECVPTKLRSLHKQDTRIVIFTNQSEIEKKKVTVDELCGKFENIINKLDIPIQLFMSTGYNQYRKPSTAMWDYFVSHCCPNVSVDLANSFFVGDAAGRPKNWKPGVSKDFSPSDRMFAANIGLQFYTPEEFFLGEPKVTNFEWRHPQPSTFLKKQGETRRDYHHQAQEMVLLVGRPASGKSTFSRRCLQPHGYSNINRDTLTSQSKCLSAVDEALKNGKSVVIDNTNPSKSARAEYIKIAKKWKVPVRCLVFTTSRELSDHLNYYRMYQTDGKQRRIPEVAFRVYEKYYTEPELTEGIAEIEHVDFIPWFDSKEDEELFKKWAL